MLKTKNGPYEIHHAKPFTLPPEFTTIKKNILIAYLCLAGICLIWGSTFLVLKIGVSEFPPFLFACLRQTIAGGFLTAFMIVVMGAKLPGGVQVLKQMVGGFLLITLGNGLISFAVHYVPSSVSAIICSAMPVIVILLNLTINRSELPNATIIFGVLAGMGGITMVFSEHLADFSNQNYTTSIVLIFISTFSWACASFLLKKSNETINPFLNAGMQMFFGGLFCLPLSLLFDDYSVTTWSPTMLYSLAYLILIGSVAAQAMYSYALTQLPLTIASMYSYVNPLVAMFLGWLVLSEKINIKIAFAILITVSGIYLVNRGYQRLKPTRS